MKRVKEKAASSFFFVTIVPTSLGLTSKVIYDYEVKTTHSWMLNNKD
jgi:hypothetical protein